MERTGGIGMHVARRHEIAPPDAEALRHRGRRRVEFVIGGAVIGASIGVVGFVVVVLGGGHRWGATAVAVAALAVAGAVGGAVIGALMEVSVEDGEDQRLAERAREDASAPLDETDVEDRDEPALHRVGEATARGRR
jgi:uncharacterized protein YcfJ